MVQLLDLPAELRQQIILFTVPHGEIQVFELCQPALESLMLTCQQLHDDALAALSLWRPSCVLRPHTFEIEMLVEAQARKVCPKLSCLRVQVFSGAGPGVGERPKEAWSWWGQTAVVHEAIRCARNVHRFRRDGTESVVVDMTFAPQAFIERRPQWLPWYVQKHSLRGPFVAEPRSIVVLLKCFNRHYNGDDDNQNGAAVPVYLGGLVCDSRRGTVAFLRSRCKIISGFEPTFVGSYTQPCEQMPSALSLPIVIGRLGIGREGEPPPPVQEEDGLDFSALHPLSLHERTIAFYSYDALDHDIKCRNDLIALLNIALQRRKCPSAEHMHADIVASRSGITWVGDLCENLGLNFETRDPEVHGWRTQVLRVLPLHSTVDVAG